MPEVSSLGAALLTELTLKGVTLPNRIVISPMQQYMAGRDGHARDWHFVHLGSRAIGGAGILFTEMTNVSAQGRITLGCTGLYEPEHAAAWKRTVDFCRANSNSVLAVPLSSYSIRLSIIRRP